MESEGVGGYSFAPEGVEDLAIHRHSSVQEIVQVKSRSDPLRLSHFEPKRPHSFFHRLPAILRESPDATVRIVSFGPIGPELLKAMQEDGSARKRVVSKLCDRSIAHADAQLIFERAVISEADEESLTRNIETYIEASLVGGEPSHVLDALHFWIYRCAEERQTIEQQTLQAKLVAIGKFLSECGAHQQEWFKNIIPLNSYVTSPFDEEELASEFYRGTAARYEHILFDLDVPRPEKVAEVAEKFSDCKVVIVHGASGQGKTTLAYRYLRESIPESWIFCVKLIESRRHALSVATALSAHASSTEIPVVIYLDVQPSFVGWIDLVIEASRIQNARLLVTIREEDYTRSSLPRYVVRTESVELRFDEDEARMIFNKIRDDFTRSRFLDFEAAWLKFRAPGPLLEFVHLVTQGVLLEERLSTQIQRLEDEAALGPGSQGSPDRIHPKDLEVLRIVTFCHALGASVKVDSLAQSLALPVPNRTVRRLEKEYLLRANQDQALIQGIHPIRSEIIARILCDETFHPEIKVFEVGLSSIHEHDTEIYLLSGLLKLGNKC